ncbi:MAG: maltooligosyltrehalose trehalohydrolase, partial [Gaiellales bacterium]|nr:maltooligosyltrehalose trehalohydrolase [Gaiellales bacterium]
MSFRVWAPFAGPSVTLLLDGRSHAMRPAADGWWEADLDAPPGARYAFAMDAGEPR